MQEIWESLSVDQRIALATVAILEKTLDIVLAKAMQGNFNLMEAGLMFVHASADGFVQTLGFENIESVKDFLDQLRDSDALAGML